MSDVIVNHGDTCDLVSPRNCVHCGQVLTVTATVNSTDPSASDTDYDWADAGARGEVDHPPRVVVSDPSLVSSRSSTPIDGFVPPPAPLTGSDDECASLLSSDDGRYASSDDLDSEYVSAMEVPEQQLGSGVMGGRESSDMSNEGDDAGVFGSTCDNANDKFDVTSLDDDYDVDDNYDVVVDDDDDEVEDALPLNFTLTGGDTLQESSNSASTLLEDADGTLRDSGHAAQSSTDDDSDDEDDDAAFGEEMSLLAEVSDDADDDDNCLAPGNNPTEPLLAAAGDSDLSDAN